jgi:hypothetical protein
MSNMAVSRATDGIKVLIIAQQWIVEDDETELLSAGWFPTLGRLQSSSRDLNSTRTRELVQRAPSAIESLCAVNCLNFVRSGVWKKSERVFYEFLPELRKLDQAARSAAWFWAEIPDEPCCSCRSYWCEECRELESVRDAVWRLAIFLDGRKHYDILYDFCAAVESFVPEINELGEVANQERSRPEMQAEDL